MNKQQLKNSILQWAIQGKLVPQIASEGTAEDLLKEIRAEKERLVKEGKLKKKDLEVKPISDDEVPFEIPESWRWCRWGDLSFSIQYGYNAPAQSSGRIKMVRISDIHNNKVAWDTVPYCEISDSEIENYRLQIDDILFARTGGTVGKSFLVSEVKEDAVYAGYLIRTRFSKRVFPKFAKLFMETATYWEQLRDGTIATAQPNCNGQTLSKMMIPLPPLSEQKRIVTKIEELMPLVEDYGKAQERLEDLNKALPEKLKKSILQEAIMGKLVPQDPKEGTADELLAEIRKEKERLVKEGKLKKKDLEVKPIEDDEVPFEIPESWRWCRLGDIGSWGAGATPSKGNSAFYNNGTIPWLTTGELNNGHVSDSKIYVSDLALQKCSLRLCEIGDVLVAMYGATIGKVAIADARMTTNQACCACTPIKIFNEYLFYFIMASKSRFIELGEGGAQPNISREKIIVFPFPLPPLAEQKRIVAKVEELMKKIDNVY